MLEKMKSAPTWQTLTPQSSTCGSPGGDFGPAQWALIGDAVVFRGSWFCSTYTPNEEARLVRKEIKDICGTKSGREATLQHTCHVAARREQTGVPPQANIPVALTRRYSDAPLVTVYSSVVVVHWPSTKAIRTSQCGTKQTSQDHMIVYQEARRSSRAQEVYSSGRGEQTTAQCVCTARHETRSIRFRMYRLLWFPTFYGCLRFDSMKTDHWFACGSPLCLS